MLSEHGHKHTRMRTKPLRRGPGDHLDNDKEALEDSAIVLSISILFIGNLCPSAKGYQQKDPDLKQTRTERTLAESRVVLI